MHFLTSFTYNFVSRASSMAFMWFCQPFYNFDITMCLMRVQMILRAIATLPYKVLDLLS